MEHIPAYLWGFAVVGGPIILGLALYFGIRHSHRREDLMREDPRRQGRANLGHR